MPPQHAKPVGIIGLGLMGAALAERFLAAGYEVCGSDLDATRAATLQALGGLPVANAAELVARCTPVVLSLPDERIVRTVVDQIRDRLSPTSMLIDTSTGDPQHAAQLGAELAGQGVAYLDATISGSSAQVRRGEVLVMVGGTDAAFESARGLLQAISTNIVHTGPCGSGAQLKLVTNLVLGLNRAALAEGLSFAQALGLDPRQALSVLKASMAYSRIMDTKGEKMIERNFEPQAKLSQHLKDVRLMLQAARQTSAHLPLTEVHSQLLAAAEAAGLGQADNSAIIQMFDRAIATAAKPKQVANSPAGEADRHGS